MLTEHEIVTIGIRTREEIFTRLLYECGLCEREHARALEGSREREALRYRLAALRVLTAIVNAAEFA